MKNQNIASKSSRKILKYIIYSAFLWTFLMAGILLLDIQQIEKEALNRAYTYVKVGYDKDILYRSWVAEHGGIYVKIDSTTPPNPYLSHIPNRDIIIDSSLQFTLMNPAYMTRQVYEFQEASSEVRGHITSLNTIRPENAPDPWEIKALNAFEKGITEYAELDSIDGKEYFRYMKPFITEKSCLKCHAHQGYKVNDIRGGVSTSYPMSQAEDLSIDQHLSHFIFLGIIWIVGLGAIIIFYLRIRKSESKRLLAENNLKILNQQLEEKVEIRTQELQKREKLYRDFTENASDMMYRMALPSGKYEYVSPSSKRIFGYSPEDFYETPILIQKAIHPNWHKYFVKQWANLLDGVMPPSYEYQIIHSSGDIRWINQRNVLIKDEKSKPIAIEGIVTDISDKKNAELAMQASEEQYRALFEQSSDAIVIIDPETTKAIEFNEKAFKLLGYTREEFAKLKISDYEAIKSSENIISRRDKVLEMGEILFETKFITKTGEIKDVSVKVKVIQIENKRVLYNIAHDITESKLAAKQVLESSANINSLIENREDSIWSVDKNLNFLIFNSFFAKAYLTAYNITLQKGMNAVDILLPELKEFWEVKYKAVLTGESVKFEFSEHFGGGDHYYQVSMNPIIVEKNITGISAISIEVTDRKLALIALQNSEKNAFDLIENLQDGVAISDEKGMHNYVNPRFCEITGYSKEELLNMTGWEFTRPEDKAKLRKRMKERVAGKIDNMIYDRILVRKDGTEIQVEMSSSITVWHGKKLPMAILRDISDRKKAEKEINHSHYLMRYVIEHNRSALAVHDNDLNYLYVSKRYLIDYKVKEKDVIGKHHYDVFPDLPQKWRDVHKKALQGITSSAEDDPYHKEDGSVDWTRWECRPWHNSDGSIGGIIVYTEVITDRKIAEERIKESEANLKSLIENRKDLIWSLDKKLNFLTFNIFFKESIKKLYDKEIEKGLNAIDGFSPKLKKYWKPKYDSVLAGENIDFKHTDEFDGLKSYFQVSMNPIMTENKISGISAFGINITERIKIEEELDEYRKNLEEIVKKRTQELEEKNTDLERINKLFIGREVRMAELKEEIEKLRGKGH